MDIEITIQEVRQGHINKFELIVNTYQQKIFDYCWYMLGREQEAEDAAQEVFVKVFKQLDKYKSNTNFQAWLYKVAANQCMDILRKEKRRAIFDYIGDILSEEKIVIEDRGHNDHPIHDALKKLSISDRNIILLKVLDSKSYEEISLILQKKPDAIRKQFERAKNKLKKLLKEDGYYEELFQVR